MVTQRDIDRETAKVQSDIQQIQYHNQKVLALFAEFKRDSVIEWANHILARPDASLLIVETTSRYSEPEPIRVTTLDVQSEQVRDWLIHPFEGTAADINTTSYNGLHYDLLRGQPRYAELLPELRKWLQSRYLVAFNLEYMAQALDGISIRGACLQQKAKLYYSQEYSLSLEVCMRYMHITGERPTDAPERIRALRDVLVALSEGREKWAKPQPAEDDDLGTLDSQPF